MISCWMNLYGYWFCVVWRPKTLPDMVKVGLEISRMIREKTCQWHTYYLIYGSFCWIILLFQPVKLATLEVLDISRSNITRYWTQYERNKAKNVVLTVELWRKILWHIQSVLYYPANSTYQWTCQLVCLIWYAFVVNVCDIHFVS